MELFKYTRLLNKEATLKYGSNRLGTLFDYRNNDNHGAQVGDAKEGKVVFAGTMERIIVK